jgi:hypothetical protein
VQVEISLFAAPLYIILERLSRNHEDATKASMQFMDFRNKKGSFASSLAACNARPCQGGNGGSAMDMAC